MNSDSQNSSLIHKTAIIANTAEIGYGTSVGPYSVIGPNVRIGNNNKIASHVVIEGHTTIGNENVIFQFASVGAMPQDLKYKGENSELRIGNNNIIREYATLQPGTSGGGMLTSIGNGNLFMACSHVGHDGIVGDKNIFANGAMLAGHVTVGNSVTVGGLVGIHQFVRLGDHSMLGGGTMVVKDIPPYCIAQGDRAGLVGINSIGLSRAGYSEDEILTIERAYKALFVAKGLWSDKLSLAVAEYTKYEKANFLVEFCKNSERGITLARKKSV